MGRAEVEWLRGVDQRAAQQLVRLDLEQEAEVNREIDRLTKETQGMRATEKRVEAMMRELHQASLWEKERNGIEKERLLQEGEEEGDDADFLERETALVARLKTNMFNAERAAKQMIEEDKHDIKHMQETVIFVETVPDNEWDAPKLDVIMSQPPKKRKRFTFNKWMDLYEQQPWQAEYLLADKDEEKPQGTLAIRQALDHHVKRADERLREKLEAERKAREAEEERKRLEKEEADRLAKIEESERAGIEDGPKEDTSVPAYFRKKRGLGERIKRTVFAKKYLLQEEKLRIYRCVRDRQKVQVGFMPGMMNFKFICHQDANDAFAATQEEKELKMLPYHQQAKPNIGFHFPVYIWFEETIKKREYATHLELTHADPESPHYKDWGAEGYVMVGHEEMCAEMNDKVHPSLLLWWKNDPKCEPIIKIAGSYTEAEEQFLAADGFVQLGGDMEKFGFAPGQQLWKKYKKAGGKVHAANLPGLRRELDHLKELLAATPTDPTILHNIEKCEREIKTAEDEQWEKEKKGLMKTPLEDATEFLALSAKEVGIMRGVFHKMDSNKSGDTTVDEFSVFIKEKRTKAIDRIFVIGSPGEEADTDDVVQLTFGEFCKAIGQFCMFGPPEMIRFAFSIYDPDGLGHIQAAELEELLKMIHGPGYDVFAKQALAQFGEDRDGQLKFEEYADMNIRFPNLLYPIFRIQNKCYQKFFGVQWWERRKTIFHEARMSMAGEDIAAKDREEQARRNAWTF